MALLAIGVSATTAQAQLLDVRPQAPARRVQVASDVTFQLLATAPYESSYVAIRNRRFLGDRGNLVQVRERLTVEGDGTPESAFKLEFVDLTGSTLDPAAQAKWGEVYRNHAGLLHLHGSFGVRNVAAATANYRIYDFGTARRAARDVRRVVVYPVRMDKGIWLLDVDAITGMVLYSAEFDSNLRVLQELETTQFTPVLSNQKQTPVPQGSTGSNRATTPPSWSWRPRMVVTQFPTFDAAAAFVPGQRLVRPAIGSIVQEYVPANFQVTEDPVNGDHTLVLGYTDGIDEFFVLQTSGVGDPFKGSSSIDAGGGAKAHAIAERNDPAMRAYVFYESGLMFQVVGSGALVRLKDVSVRLCQQAVTGR